MIDSFYAITPHRGTHGLPALDGGNQGIDDDGRVG